MGLLFNAAVLYLCMGCPKLRATYKSYLQAADRGDIEACELYADSLGHQHKEASHCDSFAQHLVWLNYTHYAAVIIGFLIFGAAGSLLYLLVLGMASHARTTNDLPSNTEQVLGLIDYLPVRLTALGFLLVGNFGKALPVWLQYLFDYKVAAKSLLCKVTSAAEDLDPSEMEQDFPRHDGVMNPHLSEPKILVRLAKRNIIFLVAVASLLSITGVLA